jgi:hypothetical protein
MRKDIHGVAPEATASEMESGNETNATDTPERQFSLNSVWTISKDVRDESETQKNTQRILGSVWYSGNPSRNGNGPYTRLSQA